MFKLFLFAVTFVGFAFAESIESSPKDRYYTMVEDTSDEDNQIEGARRRGKGNKGRRRGGGGLR